MLTVEVPRSVIRLRVINWVISYPRRRTCPICSTGVDLRAVALTFTRSITRQELEEARRERLATLTLPGSWRRCCCRHRSLAEPVGGVCSADRDVVRGERVGGRLRGTGAGI